MKPFHAYTQDELRKAMMADPAATGGQLPNNGASDNSIEARDRADEQRMIIVGFVKRVGGLVSRAEIIAELKRRGHEISDEHLNNRLRKSKTLGEIERDVKRSRWFYTGGKDDDQK